VPQGVLHVPVLVRRLFSTVSGRSFGAGRVGGGYVRAGVEGEAQAAEGFVVVDRGGSGLDRMEGFGVGGGGGGIVGRLCSMKPDRNGSNQIKLNQIKIKS